MNKKVILFIVLFCSVLAAFYLFVIRNDKVAPVVEENKVEKIVENLQGENTILVTQKQIGEASFEFPNDSVKLKEETETSISLDVNKKSKIVNKKEPTNPLISETTPIVISIEKNANPKNLTIDQWLKDNAPEKTKNSKYSVLTIEPIRVNKAYIYRVHYKANFELTGGFYDLAITYIPRGTDIYKVAYYTAPISQFDNNLLLSIEDLQITREYEHIAIGIMYSIKFPE